MASCSSLPHLFPYGLHTAQRRQSQPWVVSGPALPMSILGSWDVLPHFYLLNPSLNSLSWACAVPSAPGRPGDADSCGIQTLCYLDHAWMSCSTLSKLPICDTENCWTQDSERERGAQCAVLLSPWFISEGVWDTMPDVFSRSSQAVTQGKNKIAGPG